MQYTIKGQIPEDKGSNAEPDSILGSPPKKNFDDSLFCFFLIETFYLCSGGVIHDLVYMCKSQDNSGMCISLPM